MAQQVGVEVGQGVGSATVVKPGGGASVDAEPESLLFAATASATVTAVVHRLSGVRTSNPLLAAPAWGGNSSTNASSMVAPSVSWASLAVLTCSWGVRSAGGTWSGPSGMTLSSTPTSGNQKMRGAAQNYSSGTTSGTRTAVYSTTSRYLSCSAAVGGVSSGGVELLLAHIYVDSSVSIDSLTLPAGWTLAGSQVNTTGLSMVHGALAWKYVTYAPQPVQWTTDYTQADAVAAGWANNSSQRQNGAGEFNDNTIVFPPPIVPAIGRAGGMLSLTLPATDPGYRRYELLPGNTRYFEAGDSTFIGWAQRFPAGAISFDSPTYQIFLQLHQADDQGSPPLAFEASRGALRLTGGYGLGGDPDPARYQIDQVLVAAPQPDRWYHLVAEIENFSTSVETSKLTVWVDGVAVLSDWTIPPPTLVTHATTGTTGTYLKAGIYKSGSNTSQVTVQSTAHRIGTSYAAVNPAAAQTHQGAAVVASGSRVGLGASLIAPTTAGARSGTRVDATAALTAPVAAQLTAGTTVGSQAVRATPGAAALTAGAVVAATVAMNGGASAALVSGSAVGADITQDTTLVTGTRVHGALVLDGGAGASLTTGTVVGSGAIRATPAEAGPVSDVVVEAATVAELGAGAALVTGARTDVAANLGMALAAELATGTPVGADLTLAHIIVSATVTDAGLRLDGFAAAVLVSGTPLEARIGHERQGEGGLVSATVVEFAAVVDRDLGSATIVTGTAVSAARPARTRTTGSAIVSGTVVDLDLWNAASSRTIITTAVTVAADPGAYTPVFVAPAGPAAPQTPVPKTRLLVVDTVTGRLHFELPYTALTWNSPLNGIGSCSATLPIEGALDAVSAQGAHDPRAALREVLLGPYRWSLVVAHGDVAVWGGPYIPSEDSATGSIKIGAAGLERILERRVLVNTDPRLTSKLSAPDRDLTFGQSTPAGAVYRIALAATDTYGGRAPSRALPITCSRVPAGLGDERFTYLAYDVVTAWKAISDIAARDDGPDLRLEPVLVDTPTGAYCQWDLQIGDPFLPASGNHGPHGPLPWTFDDTNAVITRSVDAVGMATAWWSTGDGQDREKKIVRAATDTLTAQGFPALEHVDSGGSSQADLDKLESGNRAALAAHQAPADTWKLSAPADGDPPLGAVRRGELARLDVTRQVLIEPGYYPRRITDVAGDATSGRYTLACDEMETPLVETDLIPPSTGIPEPYVPPRPPVAPAVKVTDLTGPGYTEQFGVGGTDLGIPVAISDGQVLLVFGDTFEQASIGGPGWRSPVGLYYGVENTAPAAQAPTWAADLGPGSTVTNCVAAGYADNSSQRQNGAGAFNDTTTPWPLPVVAAPGGRPGRAVRVAVPDNYRRVEMTFPSATHGSFGNGAGPWYFGTAVCLETWHLASDSFQTFEQIKQASTQGSPPLSFEVRSGGRLIANGGWGIDATTPTRLQWERTLLEGVQLGQRINLVYRIDQFSTAEGGSKLDVWVNGAQVLEGFTIPPPTVIPDGAGAVNTYRKQGIYHSSSLPAASLHIEASALGRSYAAVDPAPTGTTATVGPLQPTGVVVGYGGSTSYAGQLVDYAHNTVIRGEQVSTQLPTDLVRIGNTIYLHVMACNGLGNVRFTEVHRSVDNGRTWGSTGVWWPGTEQGGMFQLPTFCPGGDGYIYALSTGFQRDKGLILLRVPEASFLDKTAWRVWNGASWASSGAAIVLPGAFGEMCLRRIDGRWVLTGFDAGNYRIDVRVFDQITEVATAPVKILITGTSWDREDHARGQVAQLYGGYIVPGSTFAALHLVVSQWNTGTNWPYRSMQFRSDVSSLTT